MCLGTLVTQRLCSEGTKRFIRVYFVLRGHTETYQRFTMLRGHWYIIALRECSGISAGIPFGQPQVVVDWERVIWRLSFLLSTLDNPPYFDYDGGFTSVSYGLVLF